MVDLLRRAGEIMGTALASVVSMFNPALLVIGGGMSRNGDDYLAAIREVIHGRAKPLATRDLRIVKAKLGASAGVVGTAAMAADELFGAENLASTVERWASDRTG